MQDNLIDDTGFELGLPTREEMLKHQCDLLCSDLELTRRNLRAAHRELAGLIVMYRGALKEVGTLRAEVDRLKWTLSDIYLRQSQEANKRMVYAYGDHTPSLIPHREMK
ncbi:hypothetical protein ELZ14_15065 [Pseudomonas brassicacearum]|nr:hypothetical protein ELZ14_15065 [Pseudomonas brassicacearum]